MKFTNGYWMNRPDVMNSDAVQVRGVKIEKERVYLYIVPYPQDQRGMGGPVLEMYISSPQTDILRTEVVHFIGSAKKEPKFELEDLKLALEVTDSDDELIIKSGELSLEIKKNPCSFTYYYNGKMLTKIGNRFGHSMISTIDSPDGNFMRAQFDLDIGEKVYGLGERFTPFVKNGQVVDMWNEDGGTCSEISYKNIPFYVTSKCAGVFVNSSDAVSYEICSEIVSRVQFSVPGEKLDFMVIGGGSMKRVLERYTTLTGRPGLPPAKSFGLWLTSSFTTSYDEKTVSSFVDGMKTRNIPLHVFHFDCFWMKENEWCNFEWDSDMFGDVKSMLRNMKDEKGLDICVWINPYIAQKSPLFKEAMEKGYLLKKPDGSVWQWDLWQAGMGIVDFTNPDAWKWYQEKLKKLLDQGVTYFKTDFGERIPTDVVYFDGSDPQLMHNYYTYLYNKCVFELLENQFGKNQVCLFARSATAGGQKFPVHWGGDCSSNYLSMLETLRGGLSLCMSGFGFWSHDISGFEGTATSDVYKRWVAFGLLSTHSRLHGSNSYRVPWLFGDEAVDVLRFFTNLKCTLMPYIFSAAVYAHKSGVPVMRAMALEFEDDPSCLELDRQYMLGDNLLVAPVFTESGEVEYYLPKGLWTNILSNEPVTGGEWKRETHDFFSLPLLARENSIIPFGADNSLPDYDYFDSLTLHVFSLKGKAACTVFDSKGEKSLEISAENSDGKVTFSFSGPKKALKLLMRNTDGVRNLSGGSVEASPLGAVISVEDSAKKLTFEI